MYIAAGGVCIYSGTCTIHRIGSCAIHRTEEAKKQGPAPKEKRQTFPSQVSFLFFCFSFLCFSIASNALRSTESRAEGLVFRHLHQPQQLPLSLTVHYVPALHIPFFLFRFFFLFFFFPYNPHVYKQDTHTHKGEKKKEKRSSSRKFPVSRMRCLPYPPSYPPLLCPHSNRNQ